MLMLFISMSVKADGFGLDEPNKPLVIEGPMISVHVSDDTILQICRDIRHPESNQPIYDWLLSQLYQLRESNPKYPAGTKFRLLLESSHWYYQRIRATVWQKQTNILK